MKKRVISLCLIVSLMVALFPIAALSVSAETVVSGTSSEGFLWELDSDGTLTILGEGEMEKNSPAGGGYMSWVDANLGTSYMDQVKKIVLSDGITNIGKAAFDFCRNLVSVEIPSTVLSIDDYAFECCFKLETVVIPNSVTKIGLCAFQGCEKLINISIPGSVVNIEDWAFADCDELQSITFLGDAPAIGNNQYMGVFEDVNATAYYPLDNPTWTSEVMQNYGGILTWVPMDSIGTANPIETGPSLFIPVVESRIAECRLDSLSADKQQEYRGLLYDLDGDNTAELILQLKGEYSFYYEVWSITSGKAECVNKPSLWGTDAHVLLSQFKGSNALVYQDISYGSGGGGETTTVYTFEETPYKESCTLRYETIFDIDTPDEIGDYYYINESKVSENEYKEQLSIVTSGIELFVADTQYEGLPLPELISFLQSYSDMDTSTDTDADTETDIDNEEPVDDLTRFLLKKDGWGFANDARSFAEDPVNHADDYFIPRERYDDLFGSAYVDAKDGLYTEEWRGSCAGMSTTAILFFLDQLDWESIDTEYAEDFANPNDFFRTVILDQKSQSYYPAIGSDTEVTRLIEAYQLYINNAIDHSKLVKNLANTYFEDDVTEKKTLFGANYIRNHIADGTYIETMLAEFQEAYNQNNPLLIALQADGYGHAIVSRTDLAPEDMGDGWWRVYVYDPNKPYINETVGSIVSGLASEPKYMFGCNNLIDNGKDTYLELNPSLNQWRYCTAVNSNSSDDYIGSSPSGKLRWKTFYYDATPDDKTDDEGRKNNAKLPEYFYTIDLSSLTMEDFSNPHFDSTSAWIPENDLAVVVDGSTDCSIYTSTGELAAIVEDGDAFVLSDSGSYDAYIDQTEDGSSPGGKIYLPDDVYTVYYNSGAVQFLGYDNALSFSCAGAAELTVDITLNSLQIIAQENGTAAVKCANVTSTDECSYVSTEGALVAGESFTIAYSDENQVEASTDSRHGKFRLYQKDADQEDAVATEVIKAGHPLWPWLIGGVVVSCAALFLLMKKKKPNT